jgi:hypothetical protein
VSFTAIKCLPLLPEPQDTNAWPAATMGELTQRSGKSWASTFHAMAPLPGLYAVSPPPIVDIRINDLPPGASQTQGVA